ncbi:MAG: glycine zipper domain-containing protein [Pseudomonadota bacterium]|nr:glycine zipper domain-containing protein [Pseudomonadota bacterium]
MDIGQTLRCTAMRVVMVFVTGLTAGCESMDKQDMGTAIGGVVGGLIGYKIDDGGMGGVLIGAAVGGLIGNVIGNYMDESDRQKVADALDDSPSGVTTRWHNKDTGYEYALTPTSDAYPEGDNECRNFDQEVIVDGERKVIQAVACKQSGQDNWEVTA